MLSRTEIVDIPVPVMDPAGALDCQTLANVDAVKMTLSHGTHDEHRQRRAPAVRDRGFGVSGGYTGGSAKAEKPRCLPRPAGCLKSALRSRYTGRQLFSQPVAG